MVGAINLGTKRIAGFTSEFLVLGSLDPDGTVRLLQLEDGVAARSARGLTPRASHAGSAQKIVTERRRRSRWCSIERRARCSTSVVAGDGGSLSA